VPRVPDYGAPRVRSQGLGNVRRQAQPTPDAFGAAASRAMGQFGEVVAAGAGQVATMLVQAEQQRQDRVALTAAQRALGDLEIQVTTSPEYGYRNVRGKDALGAKRPTMERFDQQAAMIESTLNARQLELFIPVKERQRQQLVQGLDEHGLRELQQYEKGEALSSIVTAQTLAAQNALRPDRIAEQVGTIERVIADHSRALGLTGPEQQGAFKREQLSKLHEGVLLELLAKGRDVDAKDYFYEVRQQIEGSSLPRLTDMVEQGASDITGLRAAETVYARFAPANDTDAVEMDKMLDALTEQYQNDPRTLKAAKAYLSDKVQAVNAARRSRDAERDNVVWTNIFNGRSLSQVASTAEFQSLPGAEKDRIRLYYQRQAEHASNLAYQAEARAAAREAREASREGRELTRMQREEYRKEINGWATYFDLSNPETLRTLQPGDIAKRLPDLGHAHVQRLMTDREQLLRQTNTIASVTLDTALFKQVAEEAGLDYVTKTPGKLSQVEKANLAQLEVAVKSEIARQQQAKGGKLDYEETLGVARQVASGKAMVDDWFRDTPVVAAAVAGEQRSAAYIPLDQINVQDPQYKQRYTEALNYLRGLNPRMSEQQLRSTYRRRIEKALYRSVYNGTREEIENALKGVD
jgi:hypothetical protein